MTLASGAEQMIKTEATFGFISYYIFKKLRRIPVQFFRTTYEQLAWLDGGPVELRLHAQVREDMDPKDIGNFAAVMKAYPDQAKELFTNTRLWQDCIDSDSGLLLLFHAMHEMHVHGISAENAVNVARVFAYEIRNSEDAILKEMMDIFRDPSFNIDPQQIISVRPLSDPVSQGTFSFA
jgi:hypothetical protein